MIPSADFGIPIKEKFADIIAKMKVILNGNGVVNKLVLFCIFTPNSLWHYFKHQYSINI